MQVVFPHSQETHVQLLLNRHEFYNNCRRREGCCYSGQRWVGIACRQKPLWLQMNRLNPPLPNPKCQPHVWEYEKIRPSLLEAGRTVTEKQAERRVLMLINPARGATLLAILASAKLTLIQKRLTAPIQSMLGSNWSCRMRLPQLIVTLLSLAASSLREMVASLRSMAAVFRCSVAM